MRIIRKWDGTTWFMAILVFLLLVVLGFSALMIYNISAVEPETDVSMENIAKNATLIYDGGIDDDVVKIRDGNIICYAYSQGGIDCFEVGE
jgi:preprotein translocase subunit YajC